MAGLLFVEGTAHSPNCTSIIDGNVVSCGYGDNLLGAQRDASALGSVAARKKLVWSQHTYGPSQHDRPEFHNSAFPDNMKDVWEAHWGALVHATGPTTPAVVLGEWGGPVSGANGKWMSALADYLAEKELSSNFFWALNQDGSPAGIIEDWSVNPPKLDAAKLALLHRVVPNPTKMTHFARIGAEETRGELAWRDQEAGATAAPE